MRRIVTWVLATISIVVLLFGYHTSTSGPLSAVQGAATPAVSQSSSGGVSRTPSGAGAAPGGAGGGSGGTGADSNGTGEGSNGTGGSHGAGGSSNRTGGTMMHRRSTVTGPVIQTQWGPVQVQVTTNNKRITRVSVLQYPSGNSTDQQINDYALPILVQNTLDAQSADIDMVSGATYTSTGYIESLQAALDKAGV